MSDCLPPRLWCALSSWSAPGRVESPPGRTDLRPGTFLPCRPPWAFLQTGSWGGLAPCPGPPSPGAQTPTLNSGASWVSCYIHHTDLMQLWCCRLFNHRTLKRNIGSFQLIGISSNRQWYYLNSHGFQLMKCSNFTMIFFAYADYLSQTFSFHSTIY